MPRDTPKDIIAKLNATMVQVLADPRVQERFEELGIQITPPTSNRRKPCGLSRRPRRNAGGRSSRRPTSRRSESRNCVWLASDILCDDDPLPKRKTYKLYI